MRFDLLRRQAHAPVILVAGNHGKELDGDLYVYSKAKGKYPMFLCTEPELIEFDQVAVAVFPHPRKAETVGASDAAPLQQAFIERLEEFNRQFDRWPGCFRLFFGHFGVAGASVSSGQPLVDRCAEYPLEPLRDLRAQYVGLNHIHLRQQLASRARSTKCLPALCGHSPEADCHMVAAVA